MNTLKKFLPLIFVILLSFWAVKPLFSPGFFPMHDDTQVARVFEMTKSLKLGMFPVRWVPDLGYGLGYPIFNFYAPLAYYIGSIFSLIGFDALASTKIMIGLGIILSGIFMYFFAKDFFGKAGGVVSAIFYVYAPYHALDTYVRGDVAELWAYAFIPLAFFGFWKAYKEEKWIFLCLGSLGYAGIILSHNLTGMMISPFLLLFALILIILSYREKHIKKSFYFLGIILFGILISAFYWLPALTEMKNTNVSSILGNIKDNYVCINQLWTSPWGYGGSIPGCVDGLSFMAGKFHILVSFFSFVFLIILFVSRKKMDTSKIILIVFSFLAFIFSLFLTLALSGFLWDRISLMQFFQFPWRFLLTASFFSSILAGSAVWLITFIPAKKFFPHFALEVSGVLIFILLLLNVKFFVPQRILNVSSAYYTSEYSLKWTTSKISDEYLPKDTKKPKNPKEALLNKQVFIFKETPIETASDLISLAGIGVLFAGIILSVKKRYA